MSGKELPEYSPGRGGHVGNSKPLDLDSNSTVTGGTSFINNADIDGA